MIFSGFSDFTGLLMVFFVLLLFPLNLKAQEFPPGFATPICDGQSISTGAPEDSGYNNIGIQCGTGYSSPLSPYIDFYYVVIQTGTTFTFVVSPEGEADYDFAAWLNPVWEDLSQTPFNRIRGSQNNPFLTGQFDIGLSLTSTELCEEGGSSGAPEPGMVKYFSVEPGDEILIAIDRWSQTDLGYEISFGGDAILDCTILGNDFYKCASSDTQSIDFEEEDILPELQSDYPDHTLKFYANEESAQNGQGAEMEFPISINYNDGQRTPIYVRIENQEGLVVQVLEISLWLTHYPEFWNTYVAMDSTCDDGEGRAYTDLNFYKEAFLGPDQPNLQLVFYADLTNYQNSIPISNPGFYQVSDGQVIIVEIVNPRGGCRSENYGKLEVFLDATPYLDLSEYDGEVICTNENQTEEGINSIYIESGLPANQYLFTWSRDGEILPETGPSLEVTQGGNYGLWVENNFGAGCEASDSFKIIEQTPPQFKVRPTKRAFEGRNGILVYDISGTAAAVFKLDDGDWQSPQAGNQLVFSNVSPGLHWVYGKDLGGCGIQKQPIRILDYPDFFTPNGDGVNDTWNIDSLKDQPNAVIYIFDRYGKLLNQIKPNGIGWDGTFGGKNMPANEYWFKVKFTEKLYSEEGVQEINSEKTGHFLLVR